MAVSPTLAAPKHRTFEVTITNLTSGQGLIGVSSDDAGTGMTNPALAEGGVIHHHAGIAGGNDLVPGVHGWTNPVVEITVARVS